MKISVKLFLILLGATASMLVVAMGLARYSFQQGFIEFVGAMEEVRLQSLAYQLVQDYEANQNEWAWLEGQSLNRYKLSSHPPPHRANMQARPFRMPIDAEHSAPPPRGPRPHKQANLAANDTSNVAALNAPRPSGPSEPRTAIFDRSGKFIAGYNNQQQDKTTFTVSLVSNNDIVGELRSWPTIENSSQLSALFAQQQLWSNVMIGLFCLILTGIASWVLSRRLLLPIYRLRSAISALSAGNYRARLNSKRADELGELMSNLDILSDTLEKNRSAKSRLFADISHELRTPLTVLKGEIDLLKAGIRPFNQMQLRSLEQECDFLIHLVKDLYQLSLSDVGGLKYNFTNTDLSASLCRCINSIQQRAQEKSIEIKPEIASDIHAMVDEKRIEQLLLNLLMNAVTYTDSPGQIEIILRCNQKHIVIVVADSSPGVDEMHLAKLFEPLYRVDAARTRRESGAGLGLTICKNIVEAHQGQVIASASDYGGLCVTITLPISRYIE